VKPYVKTNKCDYIDAEAIAEAVGRPTMRFVPVKSFWQAEVRNSSTRESFAPNAAQGELKVDRDARPLLPTPHKSCGARYVVK
jgi:hypothetical protein